METGETVRDKLPLDFTDVETEKDDDDDKDDKTKTEDPNQQYFRGIRPEKEEDIAMTDIMSLSC